MAPADARKKVAIVTGGSSGIGLALCAELRGTYTTYSLNRNPPPRTLEGVTYLRCDITSVLDVEDAIRSVPKPIDLLVNNAAIWRSGKITEMPVETFRELVNTNIFGNWLMIRETWRHLAPGATVVQISSERADFHRDEVGVYGVTKKAAMEMALRVGKDHPEIAVKIVRSGPVDTPMLMGLGDERRRSIKGITISAEKMAGYIMALLRSQKHDMLVFDDPREPKGTGNYILTDSRGVSFPLIL